MRANAHVAADNAFSVWLARFVARAIDRGIYVCIGNPQASFLWRQPEWRAIRERTYVGFFETTMCSWGTPWRKAIRFLTNGDLQFHGTRCPCSTRHLVLRGTAPDGRSWTSIAASYPAGLADFLA